MKGETIVNILVGLILIFFTLIRATLAVLIIAGVAFLFGLGLEINTVFVLGIVLWILDYLLAIINLFLIERSKKK